MPAVAPDVYEQSDVIAGDVAKTDKPARLLWFGRHASPNAPAGMADLQLVRDPLLQALASRPFELIVCSDNRERFDQLFKDFPVPTRFVDWAPQSFAAELARADGVLLPLSDNPFVAAKTHNRLSLALSAGVPVVADRLDSYEEFAPFAYLGDWPGGLEAVLLRPHEARARAAAAAAYLQAHWSAQAIAPHWETALGLPNGAAPRQLAAEPLRLVPHVSDWFASHGRSSRRWILAGQDADPGLAGGEACLVMSLGAAIERLPADLAYILDAETLAAQAGAIEANARFLLVPGELHSGGWVSGRGLDSWGADLPILRRLRQEGRLVRFDLWTGAPHGVQGDFNGDEVPLRLLVLAGVRHVRSLGVRAPGGSCTGFEGLVSILDRRSGGLEALMQRTGLDYAAL